MSQVIIPPGHRNTRGHQWTLMKFSEKDWQEHMGNVKYGKGGNLIEKMEKLTKEIFFDGINQHNTTLHPINRINSKKSHNPLKDIVQKFNILLLEGIEESSRRDTQDAPRNNTGVQYSQVGTDGTAESESQTGVIASHGGRFDLDTHGQRSTQSQTSKYNDTITDADVTVPVTLKEAALYNASAEPSEAHARIQYPDFNLIAGERFTMQINELQQNL